MKHIPYFLSALLLATFGMTTSCVSTSIEEPDSDKGVRGEGTIILNLSAPDNIETRADDGYKLRYIAKIFQAATIAGLDGKAALQRKEIAGDDVNERNNKNQIIFQVEPNYYYTIIVFADYIPKEYERDKTTNCYNDYFYNTNIEGQSLGIYMNPTPGINLDLKKTSTQNLSPDFFNNDNYDCFYTTTGGFEKLAPEIVFDLELKRAVAKVRFQDISSATGDYGVKISKATVRHQLDMKEGLTQWTDEFNTGSASMNLTANTAGGDVLWFYSLAHNADNQYVGLNFTVTKDGKTESFPISNIPVKRNYQTIVKGGYLSGDSGSSQDDPSNPSEDPDTSAEGDIILNLSSEINWEQTELTK